MARLYYYKDGQKYPLTVGEPPIDETLTEQGQAADAKAVGDAIADLQQEVNSTFQLIETITVTESGVTAIERSKKPNGEDYAFSEIRIDGKFEIGAGNTAVYVDIQSGNGNHICQYGQGNAISGTVVNYWGAGVIRDNGLNLSYAVSAGASQSGTYSVVSRPNINADAMGKKITKFIVNVSAASEIPVGSVLKIYAR